MSRMSRVTVSVIVFIPIGFIYFYKPQNERTNEADIITRDSALFIHNTLRHIYEKLTCNNSHFNTLIPSFKKGTHLHNVSFKNVFKR